MCLDDHNLLHDLGHGGGGNPALSRPEVMAAALKPAFMGDTDRILGVVVNGEARAYPLGILWWHEIMNDTLGGQDLLLTYCPLTGSGIAFDPTVDSELRTFSITPLVYQANLVMVDGETESLWVQMLLGSQCGLDRGAQLRVIPIVETTWGDWSARYPNTTVVTPKTGFDRPYFIYPFGDYADPDNDFVDFVKPGSVWGSDLRTKELVLGVFDGSVATAYPLVGLADSSEAFAVNDEIAGAPIVVMSQARYATAQAFSRSLDGQTLTFTATGAEPFRMVDAETGSEWNARAEALAGPLMGAQLEPLEDSFIAFWFAWSIYFPATQVFQ